MMRKIFCVQLGANLTQEKRQRGQDPPFPPFRVHGSMVEHQTFHLDYVGSIPTVPTKSYAALIRAI